MESSNETSTAAESNSIAEVLMPRLQKQLLVLFHNFTDCGELVRTESMVRRKTNRCQPVFCHAFRCFHVNVRRLLIFQQVEEESIWTDTKERWHRSLSETLLDDAAVAVGDEVGEVLDVFGRGWRRGRRRC